MMLLPSVLYIVALVAFPFFLAIAFSFSDVSAGDPSFDYVGLRNFRRILGRPGLPGVARNTLVFTGIAMAILVLAKILATGSRRDSGGSGWSGSSSCSVDDPWSMAPSPGSGCSTRCSPLDWILQQVGVLDGDT